MSRISEIEFDKYLDWLNESWDVFYGKSKIAKPCPNPIHPGTILELDFLVQHKMSQSELARKIGCTHAKINSIIKGKRRITCQIALDLEKVFDAPANYWMSLQIEFDLWELRLLKRSQPS